MSYQTSYQAKLYLTFAGRPFVLTGNLSDKETIFSLAMPDFTIGEIINGIIHMVKPGYTLQFDQPWSILLDKEISGFELLLKVPTKDSKKPIEFGIAYKGKFPEIPGFKISSLSIFARSIRDVNFNMTGNLEFLGLSYPLDELFGKDGVNLLDPQGMPKPEPKDKSIFKLNFLGAGQHLALQNASNYNHIDEVVDQLSTLMQPPAPGVVVPAFSSLLNFDNNSQWLFAIDAVVMDTVDFKIAFNDPALYGLFLKLHGEKAKVFDGLEFEILYKKITDDLGVYQIELKLPDAIRNIELGAVSITLPIVGIWIYTNGNFKIDLGFPYNNDFSRSFTVQAFPFTGAGGFYFAVLNGSTSLTLPSTTLGTFSPVLEFGLGLNLGLGKTFNKGILSAGLTIVFYGIVEGTLAWFKAIAPPKNPTATDFYYKLKGTFGIVGHIYGSVNFAIISATLDIMVYAQATITIEAAEPILLAFEAGVSIELTVKISLGFFSIRIHLSFSATVSEQFTIGSPSAAQWKVSQGNLKGNFAALAPTRIVLNWGNLVSLDKPQEVDLYFIPFFSATKIADKQETVAIASLFTENNDGQATASYQINATSLNTDSPLTPFDKLCIGLLTWTFNAASTQQQTSRFADLLTDSVTAKQIDQINTSLSQNQDLFSYPQLIQFIKELFVLNIIEVPDRDKTKDTTEGKVLPLTVFPMIPDLFLSDTSNGKVIDFSTFNAVNETYISNVLELVSQFTDNQPATVRGIENALNESMATLLFRDYFQLVIKSLAQSAQDYFASEGVAPVQDIATVLTTIYQRGGFNKAGGSASRFALHGLILPEVTAEGGPGKELKGLYVLSGQQFTMPTIDDPKTFSYTLTLSKANPAHSDIDPTGINWLTFNGQAPDVNSLIYGLSESELERIYAFQSVEFGPIIEGQTPKPIKLYQDQSRVFGFSNPILWNEFDKVVVPSLWTFPSSLLGVGHDRPHIILNRAEQDNPMANRKVTPVDPALYFYGTLLPITLKKVNHQTNEKIDKCTFEVFGTDANGIEMLTTLLRADNIDSILSSVTVMYAEESADGKTKALKSDDLCKLLLLLINTNLSTETNPELLRTGVTKEISNTTPIDFISRLWKSSLVRTGGYYLYYDVVGNTLPETLFDSNGNGEVYLMIQYKTELKNQVEPYMNIAGLYDTIKTSELLFGEWQTVDLARATPEELNKLLVKNQIVRNATMTPGNIGFDLVRTSPDRLETEGRLSGYAYELQLQYNLLNYRVKEGGNFKSLKSVAPVGPSNVIGDQDFKWNYNKAMPIGKFYTGESSSAYVGLGETVSIGFNWQDNYGNTFNSPVADVNYKILYFDQLVPFSAWPSLTIDYYFYKPTTADSADNFMLTFHFVPGQNYSFKPSENGEKEAVVAQAKKSLNIYQGIYDQINQQDISIYLQVSLDPTSLFPLAPTVQLLRDGVRELVLDAIAWIVKFISDPDDNNQYRSAGDMRPGYSNRYAFACLVNPVTPLDVFALSTTLVIERSTGLIDPQFIYDDNGKAVYAPGVQRITNAVKPKVSDFPAKNELEDTDKSLGLKNFASHFQEAFGRRTFKLAATYIGEKNRSLTQTDDDELWVVRIKNTGQETGITCRVNYEKANFFAPQPLANFLFSLQDVPIYSFEDYIRGTNEAVLKTFNGIDGEAWASNFLQQLEDLLSSASSLPITMIDHLNQTPEKSGILANLLKAKQTLAEAIALQTIPILVTSDTDHIGRDLAAEKLKQQLLIDLYNGYLINAVVQYKVDMDSPYPNGDQLIAPNYYGKPFIASSQMSATTTNSNQNYSFSTAKIPLKNFEKDARGQARSYLTYTFESKTPSFASQIKLPLRYNISHAEFKIQKLKAEAGSLSDDLNNFEISSWLNFILPFDAPSTPFVDTEIPIPLRQYPALPVLGSQLFIPKTQDVDIKPITIEEAKLSSFTFDYNLADFVAQDSYQFEVYFNADLSKADELHASKDLSAKQKALFAKLAQFTAVDQDFSRYFDMKLPTVNEDMSDDDLKLLSTALNAYGNLANEVGDAWRALYTRDSTLQSTENLEVITATFDMLERRIDLPNQEALFEIVVSNWRVLSAGKNISYVYFPEIGIGDWNPEVYGKVNDRLKSTRRTEYPAAEEPVVIRYFKMEAGEKVYLTMEKALGIKSRSVTFDRLSVLLIQNAWGGLQIERNADLSEEFATAPEFVYTTPLNRFNNPIMPAVNISKVFRLEPLSPTQTSLKDYLQNLFAKLLLGHDGTMVPTSLKLLIRYKYNAGIGKEEMPFVSLPIALLPPTLFTAADAAGDGEELLKINEVILEWFKIKPSLNNGIIMLSAFFYSTLTGNSNSVPLLILDHLEIDVNGVSDIKE